MYRIGQEEIDAVATVIRERALFKINDSLQETMHAEEEMRALLGTENALLMTSGHAALASALVGMGIGPGDGADNVGMGLPGQHQVLQGKTHSLGKQTEIFRHRFRRIAPVEGDVQTLASALADTAQPGGEAVGYRDVFRGQIFQCSVSLGRDGHKISVD